MNRNRNIVLAFVWLVAIPCQGRAYSVTMTLPPLACEIFVWQAT